MQIICWVYILTVSNANLFLMITFRVNAPTKIMILPYALLYFSFCILEASYIDFYFNVGVIVSSTGSTSMLCVT